MRPVKRKARAPQAPSKRWSSCDLKVGIWYIFWPRGQKVGIWHIRYIPNGLVYYIYQLRSHFPYIPLKRLPKEPSAEKSWYMVYITYTKQPGRIYQASGTATKGFPLHSHYGRARSPESSYIGIYLEPRGQSWYIGILANRPIYTNFQYIPSPFGIKYIQYTL